MSGLQLDDIKSELDGVELEDQTVQVGGSGFTFEKIPMGKHPVRLVEYIEYGVQPQPEYQNEKKDPAPTVRLTFEFLSKRAIRDAVPADGDKAERPAYAPRKSVTLKKSFHEKATFRKLFEKMRGGDSTITNMAQMLGKSAWIIDVIWTTKDDAGKRVLVTKDNVAEYEARAEKNPDNKDFKIWDNIRNADGYTLTAAVKEVTDADGEPTGEMTPIKVRPAMGELRMFLWDNASAKLWASIHIEGSFKRKEGDKEIEVSKNRHQEMCMAAVDFEGSSLQTMLEGLGELPGMVDKAPPAEEGPPADAYDDIPEDVSEMDELGL